MADASGFDFSLAFQFLLVHMIFLPDEIGVTYYSHRRENGQAQMFTFHPRLDTANNFGAPF